MNENKRTLCPRCLKDYKRSKEGKKQRKLHLNKQSASWGKGNWPYSIYHNGKNKRCAFHNIEWLRLVRSSYEQRDLILKSMGYVNYAEYLGSELWHRIRKETFGRHGGRCEFCEKKASAIHHSSYDMETMAGTRKDKIHPVCKECHHKIEYFGNGEKTYIKISLNRLKPLIGSKLDRPVTLRRY